jgi:hypothetical protein
MLFALVANDCQFAVDVFVTRTDAEAALADALADEPSGNVARCRRPGVWR